MNPNNVCEEFVSIIYGIWGSYLDATVALKRAVVELEIQQQQLIVQLQDTDPSIASIEYLDDRAFGYGEGPPSTHSVKHVKTQGEFKTLNREGGDNHVLIGNLFLAAIYDYWEDHYRETIGKAMGMSKNEVVSDLFGDLRHLRTAIVHNQGFATTEIEQKLRKLEPFPRGTQIQFSSDAFENIVAMAIEEVRSFYVSP